MQATAPQGGLYEGGHHEVKVQMLPMMEDIDDEEGAPGSPLQLHVAIKKEKPFLLRLPLPVVVVSDATEVVTALPISPGRKLEAEAAADFLDDERPLSAKLTQRVRQEIDESYRHARLKAMALSPRGENDYGACWPSLEAGD
jgi:hypothetical protein